MTVYIPYYEIAKLRPGSSLTGEGGRLDPSTGLEYIARTIRLYRVIDHKRWMLTVVKTGVEYVEQSESNLITMLRVRFHKLNNLENE